MGESPFKNIGRYEIQAELGRGGFGRVFRAYDPKVGRTVAVKLLTLEGKEFLTRFRNEAAAAGKLNHRNIVTIYDFGDWEGMPYIVMEFLEGEDLSKVISDRKPLTLLQKVSIMMQAAEGLHYAHTNDVVHRDVKPSNIRLLPDGTVKVLDFGIARVTRDTAATRLTRQGDLIGTLLYMSPEQVMGGDMDARSDIFAYSLTCYELLAWKHPFQGGDPGSVLFKISSQDAELVRTYAPDCPPALEEVIHRGLHREPELRYQSLRDFCFDMEPILMELRQDRARVLLNDAVGLFTEGDLERAQPVIAEALELDPVNREARELRESIRTKLQRRLIQPRIDGLVAKGNQALEQRRFAEARESLESALKLDADSTALRSRLDQVMVRVEQNRAAVRLLSEARQSVALKDFPAAIQTIRKALDIDPGNTEAERLLQNVQTEFDRQKRREQLRQALEGARQELARNDFDRAVAMLSELDSEQRDSMEAKELLAAIAAKRAARAEHLQREISAAREIISRAQFSLAIQHLGALAREFPDEQAIRQLLASAEAQLQAQQRAEAIEGLVRKARNLLKEQQFDRALSVIGEGLRSYSGDDTLIEIQGQIEAKKATKQRAEAIQQAENEARALWKAGEFDKALKLLKNSLQTFPGESRFQGLQRDVEEAKAAWVRKREMEEAASRAEALRVAEAIQQAENEARALWKAGEFDKALKLLKNSLQKFAREPRLIELQEQIRTAREQRKQEEAIRQEQPRPSEPEPVTVPPETVPAAAFVTRNRAYAVAAVLGVAIVGLVLWRVTGQPGGTIPFEVRTSPSGAVVRFPNGDCTTPNCRLQLQPGEYEFVASLPGYGDATQRIQVGAESGPPRVDITLQALPTKVQLMTNFADGSISLNGGTAGRLQDGQFTLEQLDPGRHEVAVRGRDGEATLTIETGTAQRPVISSLPRTQNTGAVVVAVFGDEVVVNCGGCTGQATLDGTPKGQFVDGQLSLTGVSEGTHELQIQEGSAPRGMVLQVGNQPSVIAYLTSTTRDTGILSIETGVDDAIVYINDRQWPRRTAGGQLSIPLETREYTVRVEKPGYRATPTQIRAEVVRGQQIRAPFRLEPLEATLILAGQVPGSAVRLDGSTVGTVRVDGSFTTTVTPGQRRIELSREGYQPAAVNRAFSAGERVQLAADDLQLRPIPIPQPPAPPPARTAEPPAPAPAPTPPPAPRPSPAELEAQEWERIRNSRNASDFATFADRYPNGQFARQAEAKVEEIEWLATNKNDRPAIEAFIRRHPSGAFTASARRELDRFDEQDRIRTESDAILGTINRYADAFRRRDAAGVQALYVQMSGQEFGQIREFFRNFQVMSLQLTPVGAPNIAGDAQTATVQFTRSLVARDNTGKELPRNDRATFRLARGANGWLISGVTFSAQ